MPQISVMNCVVHRCPPGTSLPVRPHNRPSVFASTPPVSSTSSCTSISRMPRPYDLRKPSSACGESCVMPHMYANLLPRGRFVYLCIALRIAVPMACSRRPLALRLSPPCLIVASA